MVGWSVSGGLAETGSAEEVVHVITWLYGQSRDSQLSRPAQLMPVHTAASLLLPEGCG